MTPMDRCFQTLSVLIEADNLNGLDLMERAVDEYRDAEQARGVAALTDLQEAVLERQRDTAFRGHVVTYIDQKRRRLTTLN